MASWTGIGILALAQIITWSKGIFNTSRDMEALKTQVANIHNDLSNNDHGLVALKNGVNGMVTHCAQVSTALVTQVSNHEKDIDELKRKVNSK